MHDGAVKIGDFGFAKSVISNNQLHNTIVGTPLYMSPQQLQASKYTSKCDIWAIGLIYFEVSFFRCRCFMEPRHGQLVVSTNCYRI